jgi:hypothetical protein
MDQHYRVPFILSHVPYHAVPQVAVRIDQYVDASKLVNAALYYLLRSIEVDNRIVYGYCIAAQFLNLVDNLVYRRRPLPWLGPGISHALYRRRHPLLQHFYPLDGRPITSSLLIGKSDD